MTHDIAGSRSRHYFTEAARAKALAVRRANASIAKPDAIVFVARHPLDERLFAWEIRKFGGVVLERGTPVFSDSEYRTCS